MLIETLIEIIGIESAISLVIGFLGEGLYIPHAIDADSEIVDFIGITKAQKLAAHFGGETLQIPKYKTRSTLNRELRAFQDECLMRAKSLGFNRRQCMKVFNISRQSLIVRDRKNQSNR